MPPRISGGKAEGAALALSPYVLAQTPGNFRYGASGPSPLWKGILTVGAPDSVELLRAHGALAERQANSGAGDQ